jgi:hypothetical protein
VIRSDGKTKDGNFNLGAISEIRNKIARACDWPDASGEEPVGSDHYQITLDGSRRFHNQRRRLHGGLGAFDVILGNLLNMWPSSRAGARSSNPTRHSSPPSSNGSAFRRGRSWPIWGMETGFGKSRGNQNVLSAVATLAYDCRRTAYFTDQLYAALTLIDRGTLSAGTRGSMHGETGHTQFLPYAANPIQHRCRCIVGPYNNGHDGYPRISAADEISSLHPVAENRSVGFREPESPTVLNCQSCSKIGRSAH